MLVLARKVGERILLGDDIAITVVRISPTSVRLGVEAPRDLNIVREELTHHPVSDPDCGPSEAVEENDVMIDGGARYDAKAVGP